ncbi:MAG: cobaltochelatase subunit CobT, partial [Pseudomonadota bacterium]
MAPRPGHNTLPGNKPAPSTEPFKQSVSGTMRAIAGEAELEVLFSGDRPGLSGMTARLPEPSRKVNAHDIAVTRGLSDSMALRIACHDKSVHSKNLPQGSEARAIFEAVEQARCEAVGARRMQGVAENLAVMLDDRFRKSGAPDIASREEAPLQDALSLIVRERLTGELPPESAKNLVDMWRGWVEEKAGSELDLLQSEVEDQNSFASRFRDVLKSLDMGDDLGDQDQDTDPEENE